MDITIKKLSAENIADFLYFFDNIAFCDNPDWSACYCYFFYVPDNSVWLKRKKEENRRDAVARIQEQKLNGFLAYINDLPAGWCNVDVIPHYPRIMEDPNIETGQGKRIASAVCFIVDRNHRNKGIARQLLQSCCSYYRNEGFDYLEAYPRTAPKNDAENYYGPLSMFLSEGFVKEKELADFCVVRKYLK